MADEPNGQGEDLTASQAENQNAGSEPTSNQDDPVQEGSGPEGSGAQARIRELSKMKNQYQQEAEHWQNIARRFADMDSERVNDFGGGRQPQANANQYSNDEVEQAFNVLRQRGVATVEDLQKVQTRLEWDRMHARNERKYNQANSRYPEYNAEEVEAYARDHGIANPSAAYRDMYFDEILDAVRAESKNKATPSSSEKPTRASASDKEPLTLENFREKLASDRGFYDELAKDPAKFDAMLKELSS